MTLWFALAALAEPTPIVLTDPGDGVRAFVAAQDIALTTPGVFEMTADTPALHTAAAFVLQVDPALIAPRQLGVPVLYVGDRPARVLHRAPTGCVTGFVPGPVDWAATPVFFGSTTLPERVDQAHGAAERDAAVAAGHAGRAPEAVLPAVTVADRDGAYAAVLALAVHCPVERDDDQVSSQ